uniref:THAP domain-containing protein 1 n=1 Tax=Sphaeramia orbicularis TaxID=375764 RepID=A0A673BH58_9TELE
MKRSAPPWQSTSWTTNMAKARHASCGVVGCTHQHDSLFLLPTSEPLCKKWLDSICDGHGPNNIPKRLYVCAQHFTDECFFNMGPYSSGLAQRLQIKKDAVPTLRDPSTSRGEGEWAWTDAFICIPGSRPRNSLF